DPGVSKELLAGSGAHRAVWPALKKAGRLTLKTKLDLWQMLRPAVQPGSTLDYTPPAEKVTLVVRASSAFMLTVNNRAVDSTTETWSHTARLAHIPKENDPLPVEVVLKKGDEEATLRISFITAEDERERPLALRRFLLPWAAMKPAAAVAAKPPAELEGGHWL